MSTLYDRLHDLYHKRKSILENCPSLENQKRFERIQARFLANREQEMPTVCYQLIASYLECKDRISLSFVNKHMFHEVMYGGIYSIVFVWREGISLGCDLPRKKYIESIQYRLDCALIHGAKIGNLNHVKHLLEAKADIDHYCYFCQDITAIQVSAKKGYYDIVKLLLDSGAYKNSNFCGSPLNYAIENKHFNIVNLLLDSNVDVHDGDDQGTPLTLACQKNDLEVAKLLIEKKASVNEYSEAPLIVACQYADFKLIKLLIESNADINPEDVYLGPLSTAIKYQRPNDIIQLLLNHGAQQTIQDLPVDNLNELLDMILAENE